MSRATYQIPGKAAVDRAALRPVTLSGDPPQIHTTARRRRRLRRLVAGDTAVALVAVGAGLVTDAGPSPADPAAIVAAIALPIPWVFALFLARSYDRTVLWQGPEEFRRVLVGAGLVLAGVALFAWVGRVDVPRGVVGVVLSLATALTLAQRQAQRRWLRRAHAKGREIHRTLLVGHRQGVAALHHVLRREPGLGYRVIGCCLPTNDGDGGVFGGLPVLGGPCDVADLTRRYEVDTVVMLPSPEFDGDAVRRLGWALEETTVDLLLAPAVTTIAGPRMRIRPLGSLSLLQMQRPELRGARRLVKSAFDRAGASLLLLLLAPVLAAIAVAVKASGHGSVLVRHRRVGQGGRVYPLLTFRTRREATVTGVGRFLQRFSLDELPQLFNVLKGDMSLVGPRPSQPEEVEHVAVDMLRRLVVKPGLTGVWRGGRTGLSREESMRLDVHYVENWSLTLDLLILWRTCGAALRGNTAY